MMAQQCVSASSLGESGFPSSGGVMTVGSSGRIEDSSASSGDSSRVSFMRVLADGMFPMRAMRTMAIAITSIVSFVPLVVWKLYLPGIWLLKVCPDVLFWWSGSKVVPMINAPSKNLVLTAVAFNEVNDASVRRGLALVSSPSALDIVGSYLSERRFCEIVNSRGQTLFTQSWMPTSTRNTATKIKGLVILLHGLNEHSGRYAHFATRLNDQGYGVYAMDWIGHGGSDGVHGYVESLDYVVSDTRFYLKQITAEHPDVPMFLFGHSTGGAIALKTSLMASDEKMVRGIVLTSPAVRVKRPNAIIAALAPIFSILLPRHQFKGATRSGAPVSRDPSALVAKYTDPLVYTGPVRIRTGLEILRIADYLEKNFRKVTVPFLVLHGSKDQITDPKGSQALFDQASSEKKSIQIYEGLLHDLLFEPEKEEITQDIIRWLDSILHQSS